MDDPFLSVAYTTPKGSFKVAYCDWVEFKGTMIVLHSASNNRPDRILAMSCVIHIDPMPM